jgi:hypothetical protein
MALLSGVDQFIPREGVAQGALYLGVAAWR